MPNASRSFLQKLKAPPLNSWVAESICNMKEKNIHASELGKMSADSIKKKLKTKKAISEYYANKARKDKKDLTDDTNVL